MIAPATSSSARTGAAVVGVAGILALAGCSGAADAEMQTETGGQSSSPASEPGVYEDGTYTADGAYQTPENIEQISVTLTLADGVITDVEVAGDPHARETEQYQGAFISNIADEVVGVAIDDLDVDRVAGSSLTSTGFNDAVEDIKALASAE